MKRSYSDTHTKRQGTYTERERDGSTAMLMDERRKKRGEKQKRVRNNAVSTASNTKAYISISAYLYIDNDRPLF